MDNRKFKLWNRITALAVFAIAALTYLLTIEPTASFWDCGEFIASSYKLEVGHPPGNPVFQLFARFATMFTGPEHAAMAVNAMNALLSALTILLLYLTTVFLVKRLVKSEADGSYTLAKAITIFGSGAVGALAYTFSDTFWFSAVEGEVYAMSSLFTALVFWLMTKWYEQADEPYANRWLVLIAFLMGLSIGIHLLNLLTIPALVFLFYYRKRENMEYTSLQLLGIFGVSVVILAFILYGVIPYLPRVAAYVDLFFVNTLGLSFNTGAAFFMIALLALCFWGIHLTMKRNSVFWNTALLCFTMIVIGFSLFSIVIIRSSSKTPTNEYQPDNPFTLVRYLGREQYGSNPLIYGQAFDSPYELEETRYWAPMPKKNSLGEMEDEYINVKGPADVKYASSGKMFFPRMWSSSSTDHTNFYLSYIDNPQTETYTDEDGRTRQFIMPSFGDNLKFFFDFQMNWMYWRYFMWNFAGRQNDIHGSEPNQFAGNWECGLDFLDEARLGDQSGAPDYMKNNKGKNHYYMLPLLLGLIGIFFQFARDKRGCWVTFLMFFMTGIAIVIYLNQPPYQVRERDYAYAGSFYSFSIWIGIAVAALYTWITELFKVEDKCRKCSVLTASAITALTLGVPVLMASENWDDHDRSNRYTAVEVAKNYLNSVGENGILITHGDNDTFPLWYAQEVENIRPDVRIANTSLLGTDWHIDQMKWAMNESAPLDLKLGPMKYLYGTNEYMYVDPYQENEGVVLPLKEVMKNFNAGHYKLDMGDGTELEYIPVRSFSIPVNKENVLKYGILDEKYADRIPDEIVLTMPKGKQYITKPELFMLDLLSNYQWDRPINMLSMGGDINIGQKDYLMYEGFSFKFVPVKSRMSSYDVGFCDPYDLYDKMKNVFTWDALKRTDYFVDYHNNYTFCGVLSQRQIFVNVAKKLMEVDEYEKALEMLDMCQECVPEENYPLDMVYLGFTNEYWVLEMIDLYYSLGEREKAEDLLYRFVESLNHSKEFFAKHETTYGEYNKILEYISWVEHMYLKDVLDLIESDPELALKNLDRAYGWVNMNELPTDHCWYTFVMLYDFLEQYEKSEAIAEEYAASMITELENALEIYDVTYSAYVQAYRRYEAQKSNALAEEVIAKREKVEKLEETITDLSGSIQNFKNLAVDLQLDDVAEELQKSLSIFE